MKKLTPAHEIRYLYDQQSTLVEYNAALDTTIKYDYGNQLLSLVDVTVPGSTNPADRDVQFYHYDALGSTVNLSDELGDIKHSYKYDAWGGKRSLDGATPPNPLEVGDSVNPKQYTGHYYDEETELHYFGARYYDDDIGVFVTQDPYVGEINAPPSLHRYMYAYANPLRYVDLTGYDAVDEFMRNYAGSTSTRGLLGVDDASLIEAINANPAYYNVAWQTAKKNAYDYANAVTGGYIVNRDEIVESYSQGEIGALEASARVYGQVVKTGAEAAVGLGVGGLAARASFRGAGVVAGAAEGAATDLAGQAYQIVVEGDEFSGRQLLMSTASGGFFGGVGEAAARRPGLDATDVQTALEQEVTHRAVVHKREFTADKCPGGRCEIAADIQHQHMGELEGVATQRYTLGNHQVVAGRVGERWAIADGTYTQWTTDPRRTVRGRDPLEGKANPELVRRSSEVGSPFHQLEEKGVAYFDSESEMMQHLEIISAATNPNRTVHIAARYDVPINAAPEFMEFEHRGMGSIWNTVPLEANASVTGTGTDELSITDDVPIEMLAFKASVTWLDHIDQFEPIKITIQVSPLPNSQIGDVHITRWNARGLPTVGTITLDTNAAGVGWFVDSSLPDNSEFDEVLSSTTIAAADEASPAFGKYDLYTVLLHELGHIFGFSPSLEVFQSHVQTIGGSELFVTDTFTATLSADGAHLDADAHPEHLMNALLGPGVRRLPTELDVAVINAVRGSGASTVASSAASTSLANSDDVAFMESSAIDAVPASVFTVTSFETTNGPLSPIGTATSTGGEEPGQGTAELQNGDFSRDDVADQGFGWQVMGATSVLNGIAELEEDSQVNSGLVQAFTIPAGATGLQFDIVSANLGTGELDPSDVLEIALLDANSMASLVPAAAGLTLTDAAVNIQADGRVYFGSQVAVPGAAASGDILSLIESLTITIDLTGIPSGTEATLYFDLLGFGAVDSSVVIDNVRLVGDFELPALDPSITRDDGGPGYDEKGTWQDGASTEAWQGDSRVHAAGDGTATARWVTAVTPGQYEVYATWPAGPGLATDATYRIQDGGTVLAVVIRSQQIAPSDGQYDNLPWERLGVFEFTSGVASVQLSNLADGTVVADGILFVAVSVTPPDRPLGDMDGDFDVDFDDIAPFVQGLLDPAAYDAAYGYPAWISGDMDQDGGLDFEDIAGLVNILNRTGGSMTSGTFGASQSIEDTDQFFPIDPERMGAVAPRMENSASFEPTDAVFAFDETAPLIDDRRRDAVDRLSTRIAHGVLRESSEAHQDRLENWDNALESVLPELDLHFNGCGADDRQDVAVHRWIRSKRKKC